MSETQTKIKSTKKRGPVKEKAVTLSSIAARVLGRCRMTEGKSFEARWAELEFPMLSTTEVESVLGELVDKQLVTETRSDKGATYRITERGKGARVTVQ